MTTLNVELGERSCPVHIGRGLLAAPELFRPLAEHRQIMIVTDRQVAPRYLPMVRETLGPLTDRISDVVLAGGEEIKTLATVEQIASHMISVHCGRDSLLMALGGGVVGDITGYAAACYQRGIDFIQLPTTLLAQTDSSVGGKTGVNLPSGKNMIGAFHQPAMVVIDTACLDTLPNREFVSGLAEVIKYGLIRDADFFCYLEEHMPAIRGLSDSESITHVIYRSCLNKMEVVASDEKESGMRALLNLGHTFAHAVETSLGYKDWLHGEAVGLGLLICADLSCRHGLIDMDAVSRIRSLLVAAGLPVKAPPTLTAEQIRQAMTVDKKVLAGRERLVLLRGVGEAFISSDFSEDLLQDSLREFFRVPGK